MNQQVQHVLDMLFGNPTTMDPTELETRVEVLEARVESNTTAIRELEEHHAHEHGGKRDQ